MYSSLKKPTKSTDILVPNSRFSKQQTSFCSLFLSLMRIKSIWQMDRLTGWNLKRSFLSHSFFFFIASLWRSIMMILTVTPFLSIFFGWMFRLLTIRLVRKLIISFRYNSLASNSVCLIMNMIYIYHNRCY